MLLSQIPNNSFHKYRNFHIYVDNRGLHYIAVEGESVVHLSTIVHDVIVEPITKEEFLTALATTINILPFAMILEDRIIAELTHYV
tara:strand:+ start:297 stop:554 length:258 start_codon:yes stop_codon:yes gene_type:complete